LCHQYRHDIGRSYSHPKLNKPGKGKTSTHWFLVNFMQPYRIANVFKNTFWICVASSLVGDNTSTWGSRL
jgi:hypothetical protein